MSFTRLLSRRNAMWVVLGLLAFTRHAWAEFSQGLGDIEDATRKASAKLNDAFSAYFDMAAAIDRRETDIAEKQKAELIELLTDAAAAYEGASADGHILSPEKPNDQERAYIDYFSDNAPKYGLTLPLSQKALTSGSAAIIRQFAARIKGTDLGELAKDLPAFQLLGTDCANLQKFLISGTTYLTLG